MDISLIDVKATLKKTSESRSTLYERIARKEFPAPVKLGRKTVFVESEVNDWLAEQIANRDAALVAGGAK